MINNAFPFVIQLNCFMILMIDDYHNIHAKKVPTQLITSSAVHMASCLVDIHPTIMAVARPLHTPIHRVVRITIKGEEIDCYGGIDAQVVNQKMQQALANMKRPFMKKLPPLMLKLSPKELHESLRQLRQVNNTVKPVLSGHRIKRTPSIKRTVAEYPKFISLIYCKSNLY